VISLALQISVEDNSQDCISYSLSVRLSLARRLVLSPALQQHDIEDKEYNLQDLSDLVTTYYGFRIYKMKSPMFAFLSYKQSNMIFGLVVRLMFIKCKKEQIYEEFKPSGHLVAHSYKAPLIIISLAKKKNCIKCVVMNCG
jgi:hypothetical protein